MKLLKSKVLPVANHIFEEDGDAAAGVEVLADAEGGQGIAGKTQDLLIQRWHDRQVAITQDLQFFKLKPEKDIAQG